MGAGMGTGASRDVARLERRRDRRVASRHRASRTLKRDALAGSRPLAMTTCSGDSDQSDWALYSYSHRYRFC